MFRTDELADFLRSASATYGFERDALIAVGYSNGANIAASILLKHTDVFAGALLFRPMVPFEPEQSAAKRATPVLLSAGEADVIVPAQSTKRLGELLDARGANVEIQWHRGGHGLMEPELQLAKMWFEQKFSK
ncbi:hypothetical protein GCM10025859_48920 [Alicyclobacillus fastidiosus]|nr:hypothetical protein GCM10025859_48920 [Alicyclobacillus fastidiosus]